MHHIWEDTTRQRTMETNISIRGTSARGNTGGKEMAGKNSSLLQLRRGRGISQG